MPYIIDRRLNSKNKNTVNRQRFLRRYRKQIKKAVSEAIGKRSITDMDRGESVSIPRDDVSEPVFGHGQGGSRNFVLTGNKEFVTGDRIQRPPQQQGGGAGEGEASDSGEGDDDFAFQISQDEFLEFMFEDLALPNMVKRQLADSSDFKTVRAGFSEAGSPSQLNVVRSLRSAHARKIALGGKSRRQRKALRLELEALVEPLTEEETQRKQQILEEIEVLSRKINAIPYIDEFDLKYNLTVKLPQPAPKAVMFCLMDVSGSMTEEIKDTAKRFYFLLYLFLKRNYEKIELVFIRHHNTASEVNEHDFFYSRETGGTVVSSALTLMDEIIQERYSPSQWNIYAAQASDGDNWQGDTEKCVHILTKKILPCVQHFSYIEIGKRPPQELWYSYKDIQTGVFNDRFDLKAVQDNTQIYPVFRQLFERGVA
ncbi:YeaH/YhbH family protein [Leucothrix sargassi]|nr:YeaH/YhbH family protein [Leucothrix sargassi]